MTIEQIYTGCLAQGAYYITSNGEAGIIDPLREVQPYLDRMTKDKVKLKYIFETHFHADFVSGHLDLSRETGSPIVYGSNAICGFECTSAKDGQGFELGNIKIKALHTPGHTMESTCFLLTDENGKDHALFSGDTLFIGDVGRPDLAQKAMDITKEQLMTDPGKEQETVTRLSRVGFDNVLGNLNGGYAAWLASGKETDLVNRIDATKFSGTVNTKADNIIDVRKESEYAAEHIENAYNKPMAYINEWIKDIDPDKHFFLHCAGGYRSMIAASVLQARGFRNFTEVEVGYAAIAKTNIPKTDFICQSKMLKQ
jgi:rhodanese-related sulfurtransferase